MCSPAIPAASYTTPGLGQHARHWCHMSAMQSCTTRLSFSSACCPAPQQLPLVQVTETTLHVAERFGGWQEGVLRHLAGHFRKGATSADFGAASSYTARLNFSSACCPASQQLLLVQVTETMLHVAERFGGWQEGVLRHLAGHFRKGATSADFGAASSGLLDALRHHPDIQVPVSDKSSALKCSTSCQQAGLLMLRFWREQGCSPLDPDPLDFS